MFGACCGPVLWQHEASTLHIMRVFMNKPSCTKNSVRRSTAQWADRSGGGGIGTRNNGRWASMHVMMRYLTQGSEKKEEFKGNDLFFETWVWKSATVKKRRVQRFSMIPVTHFPKSRLRQSTRLDAAYKRR